MAPNSNGMRAPDDEQAQLLNKWAVLITVPFHRHPSVSEDNGSVPPSLST